MDLFSHWFCLTFTSLLVFLDLQEGSRMTSRCCCPLWLNIQTEPVFLCCLSVYTCVWGWSFHPLCLSLPPAALQIVCGRQPSWHARFHRGAYDQLCPLFYFKSFNKSRQLGIFFFFYDDCDAEGNGDTHFHFAALVHWSDAKKKWCRTVCFSEDSQTWWPSCLKKHWQRNLPIWTHPA